MTTKVLKNCKTFSSSRLRPRPNVQDQDQDFMIQDQDYHFCPRGASRPRPWSRGLHHCLCLFSLVSSRIDNVMVKTAPKLNQPLVSVHQWCGYLVNAFLHDRWYLIVNWMEIWIVWEPQAGQKSSEVKFGVSVFAAFRQFHMSAMCMCLLLHFNKSL